MQSSAGSVQKMVQFKRPAGLQGCREDADLNPDENGVFDEQNYIQALGTENTEGIPHVCSVTGDNTSCMLVLVLGLGSVSPPASSTDCWRQAV